MATKPTPPRGPTDDELLAVGEVTPENAPIDTLPESDEERRMIEEAKADYARTGVSLSGPQVTALLEAKRRRLEGR